MNSGTPASSAPAPVASAGISSSTAACRNVHSDVVKYTGAYGARSLLAAADAFDAFDAAGSRLIDAFERVQPSCATSTGVNAVAGRIVNT
jgi:hypothetical protein